MSQSREPGFDDQHLVRYLLGLLPEEEAERVDEMSIENDGVAWRLRVVENDLVDSYLQKTLPEETREHFESFYLSSPRRREKVRFAENLLRAADRAAMPVEVRASSSFQEVFQRAMAYWRLAAVAALIILAWGALLFQETRLRKGLDEALRQSAELDRRGRELEKQLTDQQAAHEEALKELERVRASMATTAHQSMAPRAPDGPASAPKLFATAALVLLPQTRAIGPIETIALPEGADRVKLDLRLESNEFPQYQVALRDPASSHIVWSSGRVTARAGAAPAVSVIVPAGLLKPQHYSLELPGRSAAGGAEVVGSYAFQVVPR